MQCGLCGEEIYDKQAYHFMADVGNVHRTCRKAFDRGLNAAAEVIRKYAADAGDSIDPTVAEQEIRAVISEFSDGE